MPGEELPDYRLAMVGGSQIGPVRRFVAVGDSLTEGVGDPGDGGALRGWADRLAVELHRAWPGLEYRNLAVRGWRARHVRRRQLPTALAFDPDLASVLVGANDAFAPHGFDPGAFRTDVEAVVGALAGGGATVLMATLPDFTARWPGGAVVHRGVAGRLARVNDVLREVADEQGALLLDLGADPRTRRAAMWSVDRVHPGRHGHAVIAHAFATEVLRLTGAAAPPEPTAVEVLRTQVGEVQGLVHLIAEIARHPGLPRQLRRVPPLPPTSAG